MDQNQLYPPPFFQCTDEIEAQRVPPLSGDLRLGTDVAHVPVNDSHAADNGINLSPHQYAQLHDRVSDGIPFHVSPAARPCQHSPVLFSDLEGRRAVGSSATLLGLECCGNAEIATVGGFVMCYTCGSILHELGAPPGGNEVPEKYSRSPSPISWYDWDDAVMMADRNISPPVDQDAAAAHSNTLLSLFHSGPSRPSSYSNSFHNFSGVSWAASSQFPIDLPMTVSIKGSEIQHTDPADMGSRGSTLDILTGTEGSQLTHFQSAEIIWSTPVEHVNMTRQETRQAKRAAAQVVAREVDEPSTKPVKSARPHQLPERILAILENLQPVEVSKLFTRFLELPTELREHIYGFVLKSPKAILPHLCDKELKFHDDNARGNHSSVSALLGVTIASKQLRVESVPVFYAVNTFAVGPDTASYFDHLAYLGRFHLVRRVLFTIFKRHPNTAALTLRSMTQYLAEAATYESQLAAQHAVASTSPTAIAALVGSTHAMLVQHPQYTIGGMNVLFALICLRKLVSASPHTGQPMLVLPVPHADIFAPTASSIHPSDDGGLAYFPTLCFALGITLYYTPGHAVDDKYPHCVGITWEQKYQRKDFFAVDDDPSTFIDDDYDADDNADDTEQQRKEIQLRHREMTEEKAAREREEVYKRTLAMFPALETRVRPRVNAYMRFGCGGGLREWTHILTVGGEVREEDD